MNGDNEPKGKYWRVWIKQLFGPAVQDAKEPQRMCRSCLWCLHWTGEGEPRRDIEGGPLREVPKHACDKYKRIPAPITIMYGCDQFEDLDEIPF